jgi:hypothetical protein
MKPRRRNFINSKKKKSKGSGRRRNFINSKKKKSKGSGRMLHVPNLFPFFPFALLALGKAPKTTTEKRREQDSGQTG